MIVKAQSEKHMYTYIYMEGNEATILLLINEQDLLPSFVLLTKHGRIPGDKAYNKTRSVCV